MGLFDTHATPSRSVEYSGYEPIGSASTSNVSLRRSYDARPKRPSGWPDHSTSRSSSTSAYSSVWATHAAAARPLGARHV